MAITLCNQYLFDNDTFKARNFVCFYFKMPRPCYHGKYMEEAFYYYFFLFSNH